MFKIKSFYSYLLIILIIIPCKIYANPPSTRVWTNVIYNTHFSSHPEWLYGYVLEGRFKNQSGLFYQGLIQGQLGYSLSDTTQAWMGYTLIPNTVVEPTGRVSHTIQRIYQQLIKELINTPEYEVFSRSRIEERHRLGEHGIGLVYRQLLIVNLQRLSWHDEYTPFISNEVFANLNKPAWGSQKPFNQNRLIMGWSFPCGKHNCQLAYLNQFLVSRYNNEQNNVIFFSLIL
ncbi:MAG: DUF2490 domain-containing protein [Legionella sp.]|nr:DUF2490 domain-containing protein [Legionella sp.]